MIPHKQRVAIARILSDLIKSDKIIERSEIELFNTLQQQFGINQQDRIEAQSITITDAMNAVRKLDDINKQILQEALLQTAQADNQCVAREALILLALKYVLNDTTGKYDVLSCNTHGSCIEDKFMVYIESDECESVNEDIKCDIEGISDKLRLWNFDFVYIPSIAVNLAQMDADYIKDIIRYMKPKFNDMFVDVLYDKLINITTESFTTELLGAQMNMPQLRDTEPSLLINFGTSLVPYCSENKQGNVYTDFLRIRIDDTALEEVRRFIADYDQFITYRECVRPQLVENQFKYFGFYKALFDFLSLANDNGLIEHKVIIDLPRKSLWIFDREVKLSPTELSTYILILQQSLRGHGLRHFRTKAQLANNEKLCHELTRRYRAIYASFDNRTTNWQFADNTRNIAAYIAHTKQKLRDQVLFSPEVYIPYQKTVDDLEFYSVKINTGYIFVRTAKDTECPLASYRPWM